MKNVMGIDVLQINTNRSRSAQGLLEQVIGEKGIDIVILSEPNKAMATRGDG